MPKPSKEAISIYMGATMNKEDIIRMAREAGLPYIYQTGEVANLGLVERFAALVAEAERDAILQILRDEWFKTQADLEAAIQAREQQ